VLPANSVSDQAGERGVSEPLASGATMSAQPQCIAFIVEWFDHNASMVKEFRMNCYKDNTLDLINTKDKSTFLKRTYTPNITWADLYIGASITIFNRQMHIREYADIGTTNYFSSRLFRLFCLVPRASLPSIGSILTDFVDSCDCSLSKLSTVTLDRKSADHFGCDCGRAAYFELVTTQESTKEAWGRHSGTRGAAIYVNDKQDSIELDCRMVDDLGRSGSKESGERTACIIKPHVISARESGKLITEITEAGFTVNLVSALHLDRTTAANFFDVYRGVVSYYTGMLDHMIEGPSIFVEVSGGEGVVEAFREFCGPADVEVAAVLRPKSLRARFGKDRVHNAVHCTDMATDGILECQYLEHLVRM